MWKMEKRKMQHIRTLGIFAVVLAVSAIAMIGNASGQGGPLGGNGWAPAPSPPVGPLSKDDGVTTCVNPGDAITYTICYENKNDYVVHNVTLVDTLPDEESFVSASDGGIYDADNHTVTWYIGTLSAGAPQKCVTLNVTVKPGTSPGTTITNYCTIDSDETPPATVTEQTDVCIPPPTPTPEPIPEFPAYSLLIAASSMIALAFMISRRKK
ncbi:MAG: DUF11 domain-containing protein [Candidatus Methanospirare jalkutatii]|nr:DUF11 domain-containing protein [Candidatus Methanospirare jalkutatii]